jgi:hypothetical protein
MGPRCGQVGVDDWLVTRPACPVRLLPGWGSQRGKGKGWAGSEERVVKDSPINLRMAPSTLLEEEAGRQGRGELQLLIFYGHQGAHRVALEGSPAALQP